MVLCGIGSSTKFCYLMLHRALSRLLRARDVSSHTMWKGEACHIVPHNHMWDHDLEGGDVIGYKTWLDVVTRHDMTWHDMTCGGHVIAGTRSRYLNIECSLSLVGCVCVREVMCVSPCAESRSRSRSSASSGMLTMRVDGCPVTPSYIHEQKKYFNKT